MADILIRLAQILLVIGIHLYTCIKKCPPPVRYVSILDLKIAPLISTENLEHLEGSGPLIKHSIQEILMSQCNVMMWAMFPLTKDMVFLWALWYRKCPRSFLSNLLDVLEADFIAELIMLI